MVGQFADILDGIVWFHEGTVFVFGQIQVDVQEIRNTFDCLDDKL